MSMVAETHEATADTPESDGRSLITIPQHDAYTVFTEAGKIDPILDQIKARVDDFDADVMTEEGRQEIKSFAYKLARSKTYIDKVGKEIADEVKKLPKTVDAVRKHARDTLEGLQEEVRRPLTDWEAQEQVRIDGHVARIEALRRLASLTTTEGEKKTAEQLRSDLHEAQGVTVDAETCQEFEDEYSMARTSTVEALQKHIAERERYEAEQAELEQLRKEKEEREAKEAKEREAREAKEREEKAAASAAEKARREAEEKAAKERKEAEEREARLQREKEEAEQRAKEAEERAEREAQEAREAAEREAEERKDREEREAAQRKADEDNRRKVEGEAVDALVMAGLEKSGAVKAIDLIARGGVPHVSISY